MRKFDPKQTGALFAANEDSILLNLTNLILEDRKLMQNEKSNTIPTNDPSRYWDSYASFIGMAAHDLQSPLRKLGVLTERLVNKYKVPGDTEAEQYIQRIQTCISDMQSLVEGFTQLAGVAAETMEKTSVDLEQLIRKIFREYASQVKEKNTMLGITPLPVIQADAGQLRLLFRKLLDNAFRFARTDVPLHVEVTSEELTAEEKKLYNWPKDKKIFKITVADNGMGMDSSNAEKIFHPLVRLHGRSEYPGNGLGLALVKRVVDNHCGVVFAESNPETGTRIILLLPENPD